MCCKELSGICDPYRLVLSRLVDALLKFFGDDLVSVVLYGSVARGEAKRDSDIDLVVVVRGLPRSRFRRQDLFMEAERELEPLLSKLEEQGYFIDFTPILKTPEEAARLTPLYLDLMEDAIILYDRGEFFKSILEKLKQKLQELGAERVKLGRLWYWRLKRDYEFGEVIEV